LNAHTPRATTAIKRPAASAITVRADDVRFIGRAGGFSVDGEDEGEVDEDVGRRDGDDGRVDVRVLPGCGVGKGVDKALGREEEGLREDGLKVDGGGGVTFLASLAPADPSSRT